MPRPECGEAEAKLQHEEAPRAGETRVGCSGEATPPRRSGLCCLRQVPAFPRALVSPCEDTSESLTSPWAAAQDSTETPGGRGSTTLPSCGCRSQKPTGPSLVTSAPSPPKGPRAAPHSPPHTVGAPQPCDEISNGKHGACSRLTVCVPRNPHIETRPPRSTVVGGGTFGRRGGGE